MVPKPRWGRLRTVGVAVSYRCVVVSWSLRRVVSLCCVVWLYRRRLVVCCCVVVLPSWSLCGVVRRVVLCCRCGVDGVQGCGQVYIVVSSDFSVILTIPLTYSDRQSIIRLLGVMALSHLKGGKAMRTLMEELSSDCSSDPSFEHSVRCELLLMIERFGQDAVGPWSVTWTTYHGGRHYHGSNLAIDCLRLVVAYRKLTSCFCGCLNIVHDVRGGR